MLCVTRVQPQPQVPEKKLVDYRDVQLRQLAPELVDDELTHVLIKLCHDVEALLIDVGVVGFAEDHLRVQCIQIVNHLG